MPSYVDINTSQFLPHQLFGPQADLQYWRNRVVSGPGYENTSRFGFAGNGSITGPNLREVGTMCMTAMRCTNVHGIRGGGNAYRTSTLHHANAAWGGPEDTTK